jgi:hypothetical protein
MTAEKKQRNNMQRQRSRRGKDLSEYSVKETTERNKETLYEKEQKDPLQCPWH